MTDFQLIAAVSLNGVIGDSESNSIPWHIPSDLKNFKKLTLYKTMIQGSRTFLSIPGGPLKNRRNVVLSRTQLFNQADATYDSLEKALQQEETKANSGLWVIGGASIYEEALRFHPNKLYITIVDIDGKGDVYFPIDGETFKQNNLISVEGVHYTCSERSEWMTENGFSYQFCVFSR